MNDLKIVILFNMWGQTVSLAEVHTLFQIGSLGIVGAYTCYKFYKEYKHNNKK